MKKKDGFIWVWVLIIVAIIILLAVLYFGRKSTAPQVITGQTTTAIPGQTAQGFPRAFILDPNADITASQATTYPSSTVLSTVNFNSVMTMAQLFTAYQNFFTKYHWTIANSITKNQNSRGLYATNAATDLSVSIVDQTTLRQVTVAYLVR